LGVFHLGGGGGRISLGGEYRQQERIV